MQGRTLRLLISGFGTVGRSLARIIPLKRSFLEKLGVDLKVVGIVDSKGAAIKDSGFNMRELIKLTTIPRGCVSQLSSYGRPDLSTIEALSEASPDVLVELTPSNYQTGEPGTSHVIEALKHDIHVVLANKAPLALKFKELLAMAKYHGVMIKYSATVMAGTPVLDMLIYGLLPQGLRRIRGILNGTTNYLLSRMEEGISFEGALKEAQKMGIAEADPSLDIDGWDIAAKLVILVNTIIGGGYTIHDVKRIPLHPIVNQLMEEAKLKGKTVRYFGMAVLKNNEVVELSVEPQIISLDDPFSAVKGTYNALLLETSIDNKIFIKGKGAGGMETASVILGDLIKMAFKIGFSHL